MEEQKRYKVYKDNRENSYICDTSKNVDYKTYQEFVDLLNQQDKRVKELEEENQQLKQSQKQLAIGELRRIKEYILINDKYDEEAGCNIIETFDLLEEIIDRIEKLGGGENE